MIWILIAKVWNIADEDLIVHDKRFDWYWKNFYDFTITLSIPYNCYILLELSYKFSDAECKYDELKNDKCNSEQSLTP